MGFEREGPLEVGVRRLEVLVLLQKRTTVHVGTQIIRLKGNGAAVATVAERPIGALQFLQRRGPAMMGRGIVWL